ncbi:MAG: hypothetical protein CMN78_03275 [Spirochaetales bacterium]|nr:hypothetical protein [Spirochaetales bacterium]
MEQFRGTRRLLYNASTAGWALLDSIFMTFYIAFLLPPKEKIAEGMIPFISNNTFLGIFTVLGSIMIFGRIVDAVADPLVASWSDRSKASLGRRRLFLIIGGLPLALFTVLIFFPPVAHTSWINGLYLAIVFGGYFFFFTVYVGPYLALIPELGHTDSERLGMTTAQGYFSLVGSAIVMIGGPLLLSLFMKSSSQIGAYRMMALLLAVPGLIFVYLATFSVDEKRYSNARASSLSLKESFFLTLKNKGFIIYLLANLTLWFLFNIVRSSSIFIALTLVKADEAYASTMFTVLFASAAVFFPFVWYLSRKIGKKLVMILGLGSFAVTAALFAATGLVGNNAGLWAIIVAGLTGFPVAVLLIVPNVILSELCDADVRETGQRREAMFFGVQGFFLKLNLGLSTAVLALFYSIFGKDISNPLGVRLTPVLGSIIALIGLLIMTRYPDREKEGTTREM